MNRRNEHVWAYVQPLTDCDMAVACRLQHGTTRYGWTLSVALADGEMRPGIEFRAVSSASKRASDLAEQLPQDLLRPGP